VSIERAIITKIIEEGNKDALRSLDIALFKVEDAVVTYAKEHLQKHGDLPSFTVLDDKCDFEQDTSAIESISYYREELEQKSIHITLAGGWADVEKLIKARDYNAARIKMMEAGKDAMRVGGVSEVTDMMASTEIDLHLDRYSKVKAAMGPDGVISPWETLNEATYGWHCGEVISVVGRLGTGKTWYLLMLAHEAWMAGHIPIIVSMEMSKEALKRRMYALHTNMPHDWIRKGQLSPWGESRYKKELDILRGSDELFMTSQADMNTVPQLESLVVKMVKGEMQMDPRVVVFIDGMYLMADWRKSGSREERVGNVSTDLKGMAERWGVPVIQTVQFNRQVNVKKLRGGAENIGASDQIGQNSDVVIGLFQNDDMKEDKRLYVKALKHREGIPFEMDLRWDFDSGEFHEIEPALDDLALPE